MELPILKYDVPAAQREVVSFRGLNMSDMRQEGEFSVCENLSDRRYPYLSPRKSRSLTHYNSPTAIFSWDGKLIVVDGTTLLYDGEAVGTVTPGEKQFAVINTKLCIWPDRAYLDLSTKEFGSLEQSATIFGGAQAVFTENSMQFTGDIARPPQSKYEGFYYDQVGGKNWQSTGYCTMAYASVKWTKDGGWELGGGHEAALHSFQTAARELDTLKAGDFVMLRASDIYGNWQINSRSYSMDGDRQTEFGSYGENDQNGYYAQILSVELDITHYDSTMQLWIFDGLVTFRVLNALTTSPELTKKFSSGDRVRLSGCTSIPGNNTETGKHIVIKSVSDDTLTFQDGTFTAGTESGQITVSRELPALDYICESENRLWGVSNKDKTIYASALGDPKNFYVYDGVSTDSYAVAVGSEGDFTGICKYGNAVLCWKERTLHKILGSYPAEFQMATYQYAGVRSGCHKSVVNINEVLYYLGVNGVYAYAGGTPDCVSNAFGQHIFRNGAAGTDGRRYYLSAEDMDGSSSLLAYNTKNGLWMREDGTLAVDFCRIGDKLLFLSGNNVVTMNDGEESVDWSATLSPFYETIQGRKRISRLFLRVEVPKGSWMKAQVRCDGGRWIECGKIVGGETDTRVLPIAPNRCDKFEVRLSGRGECAVLSLLREFRVGSER